MTISGELTRRQILSRKLRLTLGCFVLGAAPTLVFHYQLQAVNRDHALDPLTHFLVLALFPFISLGAFIFGYVSDTWRVVSYSCDASTFRFRKLRATHDESRKLSEVVKIEEVNTRYYGLVGYEIGFRDGGNAFVSCRLPGALALVEWLRMHRQTASTRAAGLGFVKFTYGRIRVDPTDSFAIDERVRTRYRSELDALANLGFGYQFCFAESYSIFRFVFILPLVVIPFLLIERRPIYVRNWRILSCYPVALSHDRTIWANPCESGANLYTAFTDGTFLVSAMGAVPEMNGPIMTRCGNYIGIESLYAGHVQRVEEFVAAGKVIVRQSSYADYAELWETEAGLL
jgi:hypothetical protein